MPTDKKKIYTLAVAALVALLLAMFIPGDVGRYAVAGLMAILAAITVTSIKKRSVLSINHKQVLWLMVIIGLTYIVLYLISGLKFDFYRNLNRTKIESLWRFVLPTAAVIVAGEIFRHIIRVQNNKTADVIAYFALVAADISIGTGIRGIDNFNNFMDFIGLCLFPAIAANVLYHYLSKRYGIYPNIVYRLLITLFVYVIPVMPAMPDSLFAFANLIIPIIIYAFVSALYDKKRRNATEKKNRFTVPVTVLMLAMMLSLIMLISNQFAYGSVVIATDSMTGELNRGDATIFNRYDGEKITEGQIIVFERDGSLIVHRVVDIYHINGETQYYTKGDTNEEMDDGYVTKSDIVGVVQMKVPYVGYPALWIRNLFVQ